jgi:hypothetical protein
MGTRGSPKQTNELFIPFREVEKYLSERKVQTLLKVVHDTSNIPPGANTVLKKCKRVFCILLLLGKGKLIQNFCQHDELGDDKLPFHERPRTLPGDSDFWKAFEEEQWKFCSPEILDKDWNRLYDERYILPITYKEKIGAGGSPEVYKIEIHEDYNGIDPPANAKLVSFLTIHIISFPLITAGK